MKITQIVGLSLFSIFAITSTSQAITNKSLSAQIYEQAKHGNVRSIANMKRRGISIDSVDENGNTALCNSIIHKDKRAYNILRDAGADRSHVCVKRLAAATQKGTIAQDSSWTTANYVWAGVGVAAIGGTAAALAGGGGGSGSSSSSGNNSGNNGGNDGNDDDVDPDLAARFESVEYNAGKFLPMINASTAYARFYKIDKDGYISNKLPKVKVGVIDTGVFGSSVGASEFTNSNITGFNMDYGPCRQGRTNTCWSYSETGFGGYTNVAYAYLNGRLSLVSMTKAEFDAWAAKYPADYNWEVEKDKGTSYYPLEGYSSQHGTHVAGIIAAGRDGYGMHGVAFDNAELIAGRWDFMSNLSYPIIEMIDRGAKIVNLSLGVEASATFNASTALSNPELLDSYVSGFRYAAEHDTILVFAAGNEGYSQPSIMTGAPLIDEFKAGSQYSLENLLVSVVAVNMEGTEIASYSNHCGVTKNYCIAAPGTDIYSTSTYNEPYTYKSGTSMAAPVVSGSIAFLMGAYPYMSPQEVVKLIFETAKDMGAPGVDEVYGHGLLDLAAATRPVGETKIATSSVVDGSSVSAKNTRMNVTGVFEGVMTKALPGSITILDKYNRPFAMPISNFVNVTNHSKQNFKNDVYAFSKHKPIKRIESENGVSFAYAPSSIRKSEYDLGLIDVQYQGESHSFKFYYAENTKYNSDKYFDQKLFNPYLAMNQAYGFESGYIVGGKFNFNFGFATGENGLYDGGRDYNDYDFDNRAYAFNNGVTYSATDNISVSAMSGVLYEDSALLGLNGKGGFNLDDSNTYYIGMALSWQATERLSFSGVYYQGWTDAQNLSSNLMKTSRLVSDSFALDGRYQLSKEDLMGVQISSPLRVYKGKADFDIPVGRDDYSSEVYRERFSASMKPDAREYKFSLYHMREVSDAFNFKTQFDIRLNPDHVKGAETDYRVMFGLNYNF